MARQAKVLTAKELEALANKIGEHNAGGVSGTLLLIVRETAAGNVSRAWKFRTRRNGKVLSFGLGTYTARRKDGALTVEQARAEARRILDDVSSGRDPREAIPLDAGKETSKTIRVLFAEFIHENVTKPVPRWSHPDTHKDYLRIFKKSIERSIGSLTPNDVTPEMISNFLCPEMAAKYSAGKRIQHVLSSFFRWCIGKGVRDVTLGNPAQAEAMKEFLPDVGQCTPIEHFEACPPKDLQRFVKLAVSDGRLNNAVIMAILFSILTASRQGNVVRNMRADRITYAEWKDIDLSESGKEIWDIPAIKMKEKANGNHRVPLSRQAVAILRRLQALGMVDNNGGGVFMGNYDVVTEEACYGAIRRISAADKEAGGNGFINRRSGKIMTMHGTARATFESWAIAQKKDFPCVEKSLHHAFGGMAKHYFRGGLVDDLIEERRALMQEWADFLFEECPPDWAEVKP